jgi:hypothetical protein
MGGRVRTDYGRARPPRGWLYGVVLTILIFWGSGVFWEGFRAHEMSPVSAVGAVFIVLALVLRAHQALTNNDYEKAKESLIARRLLMPLGIILFIIGRHL